MMMMNGIQVSRYPGGQTSRYPDIQISRYPDIQISRCPDVQISRYQVSDTRYQVSAILKITWKFKLSNPTPNPTSEKVWKSPKKKAPARNAPHRSPEWGWSPGSKYPDIQISRYPDIQISGCPEVRISRYQVLIKRRGNPINVYFPKSRETISTNRAN